MFDIGISEMMVIAVVALVVLGPERLPRVARQAGEWIVKLQRYVADVKNDITRQVELEELRRVQQEMQGAARELQSSMQKSVSEMQTQVSELRAEVEASTELSEPPMTHITDWDRVYAIRRSRERIRERRIERERRIGAIRPKRRLVR